MIVCGVTVDDEMTIDEWIEMQIDQYIEDKH